MGVIKFTHCKREGEERGCKTQINSGREYHQIRPQSAINILNSMFYSNISPHGQETLILNDMLSCEIVSIILNLSQYNFAQFEWILGCIQNLCSSIWHLSALKAENFCFQCFLNSCWLFIITGGFGRATDPFNSDHFKSAWQKLRHRSSPNGRTPNIRYFVAIKVLPGC